MNLRLRALWVPDSTHSRWLRRGPQAPANRVAIEGLSAIGRPCGGGWPGGGCGQARTSSRLPSLATDPSDIAPGLSSTGDEELLRRAVDNLLANVRAHTPGHTTATLTAAQCNGSITIEVSDDGPGVSPDQLARIFDRFYRSGPGRGCPPGSGLGLAIVNAVATTHNGTAQASLNDPHGLRITLTLPASRAPEASAAVPVPHTVSAPPQGP